MLCFADDVSALAWLDYLQKRTNFVYGSGHETVAVLLPGFAINW